MDPKETAVLAAVSLFGTKHMGKKQEISQISRVPKFHPDLFICAGKLPAGNNAEFAIGI